MTLAIIKAGKPNIIIGEGSSLVSALTEQARLNAAAAAASAAAAVTAVQSVSTLGEGANRANSFAIQSVKESASQIYKTRLVHRDRTQTLTAAFSYAFALGLTGNNEVPYRFIAAAGSYPAGAVSQRLTVWRRDISDNDNLPPPTANDTLIIASTVTLASLGADPSAFVNQFIEHDLGDDVYLGDNQDFVVLREVLNVAGEPLSSIVGGVVATNTLQRLAGWRQAAVGGAWTNSPLNRSPSFRAYKSAAPVKPTAFAAPSAYSVEDRMIFDWVKSTGGGLFHKQTSSRPQGRWPGGPTTNNGLARLFTRNPSATVWPAEQKQIGVDFGLRNGAPARANINTHPLFVSGNLSAATTVLESATSAANYFGSGNAIIHPQGANHVSNYENLDLDGNLTSIYLLSVLASGTGETNLKNSELRNAQHTCATLREGVLSENYLHGAQLDAILITGRRKKRIIGNYARRLGQTAGSHADVVQTSGIVNDAMFFNNTFYMPYGADPSDGQFNEGASGTTNIYNFSPSNGPVTDIISANNLLIGGGYTIAIGAAAGRESHCMAFIGDWLSKGEVPYPGSGYTAFAAVRRDAAGLMTNVLFHNLRYLEDGSPVGLLNANNTETDIGGIWNFDKTRLTPNFKAMCQILGYLDVDGNLLSASRGNLNPAAV